MPAVRTSRKRRRTESKKKRSRSSAPRNLVLGGFPKSQTVKLRYVEEGSITGQNTLVWSPTSMYDPNVTGVGSQPANFDRWMAVYDHYTVIAAKITITPAPTSTTSYAPAYLGVLLSDDGASANGMSVSTAYEQKGARMAKHVVGSFNNPPPPITHYFNAMQFYGKPKGSIVGDGTYRGTSGSSPSENAYFEVFTKTVGGNTPGVTTFLMSMDLTVVLTEPKADEDA